MSLKEGSLDKSIIQIESMSNNLISILDALVSMTDNIIASNVVLGSSGVLPSYMMSNMQLGVIRTTLTDNKLELLTGLTSIENIKEKQRGYSKKWLETVKANADLVKEINKFKDEPDVPTFPDFKSFEGEAPISSIKSMLDIKMMPDLPDEPDYIDY